MQTPTNAQSSARNGRGPSRSSGPLNARKPQGVIGSSPVRAWYASVTSAPIPNPSPSATYVSRRDTRGWGPRGHVYRPNHPRPTSYAEVASGRGSTAVGLAHYDRRCMTIAIGLQVWASRVSWADLMAAGSSIDSLGFETLWANDHFVPALGPEAVVGPVEGPVFEGWSVLSGWAAATSRVRLGCLVSGVGYRNPGLLVRMATALDHASGGRAALGIGAGWHEREHRMLGFAYPQLGQRLDRLEEAAAICRGLLDGQRVTFEGTWFEMRDAVNDPAPIQARLPLVVGGSGKKRTLRIVARYADWWNADGDDPAAFAALNAILDEHCAAVGRDPASIRRTIGQPPPAHPPVGPGKRARTWPRSSSRRGCRRTSRATWRRPIRMPDRCSALVDRLAAFEEAGASLVVFDWPAPSDPATLEALAGII